MATVSTVGDTKRVQFTRPVTRKRQTIYPRGFDKKTAEAVKYRVERIVGSLAAAAPLDPDTAKWCKDIPDDLAGKLAGVGLIPERPNAVNLAGLLDLYASEREAANKPGTQTNHRTITNDFIGCFGAAADPRRMTAADGVRFHAHLKERDLAADTIARRVRRARSIFAWAVKKNLIPDNPFTEVKAASVLPADRKDYARVADVGQLLAAAPPPMRTILALARFAGLRCPSEVFTLRWADVDLAARRMVVTAPKAENHAGKATRRCPILARLRPCLGEAAAARPGGAEYVVGGKLGDRVREKSRGPRGRVNVYPRTPLLRLFANTGLKP